MHGKVKKGIGTFCPGQYSLHKESIFGGTRTERTVVAMLLGVHISLVPSVWSVRVRQHREDSVLT